MNYFCWNCKLSRISTSTHGMNLKLAPVMPRYRRSWLMTSWLLSRSRREFNRPETKRGPDAQFQVRWLLLSSNFVRYIKMIKNVINDVIMTITWPGYNLQTGYKMRTRFNISGSPSAIVYKLRYVRLAKKIDKRHHHEYHVIWLQFTDLMQNEDLI